MLLLLLRILTGGGVQAQGRQGIVQHQRGEQGLVGVRAAAGAAAAVAGEEGGKEGGAYAGVHPKGRQRAGGVHGRRLLGTHHAWRAHGVQRLQREKEALVIRWKNIL